jgi:hypothetical protein
LNTKENLINKMSLSYFLKVPPYGGFRGLLDKVITKLKEGRVP